MANLQLVSARPPLAPSYPADLAWLINGALFATGLIYFLGAAQSLWVPPSLLVFGYAAF
jgi:hypothetical protein